MDKNLIKMFNVALKESATYEASEHMDALLVNLYAVQRGYLIHPDVCNYSVYEFLEDVYINPNATFFQTWEDIKSRSEEELVMHQLIHYVTTYGTGFAFGNGYVPNDVDLTAMPVYQNVKVIMPISEEDLYTKCIDLLMSGVALKKDTMTAVANYVVEFVTKNEVDIDIDELKNKEARIYLYDNLNVSPKNPNELFRYIIYRTTGDTMVVKNKALLSSIKLSPTPFNLTTLNDEQIKGLSTIFLRNKNVFLAFKHNLYNGNAFAPIINKMRKLAIKNHKPMERSFWGTLLADKPSIQLVIDKIGELNSFKIVSLMMATVARSTAHSHELYTIRNQKLFIRDVDAKEQDDYYGMLYIVLRNELCKRIANNRFKVSIDENGVETKTIKTVRVLNGLTVALPSSEKSYVGNYPMGTAFQLSDHNFFGVYWRNEWGTRDYDLSYIDIKTHHKYGWNGSHKSENNEVLFSGDMTNANPEAVEMVAFTGDSHPEGVVYLNQFNGNPKSKCRMFFGQEEITKDTIKRNYMVDPNNIKFQFEIKHENTKQMNVGLIMDDKFYVIDFNCGTAIVSAKNTKFNDRFVECIRAKTKTYVDLEGILRQCGYEFVDETYKGVVDVDFANLDKDTIINLMKD